MKPAKPVQWGGGAVVFELNEAQLDSQRLKRLLITYAKKIFFLCVADDPKRRVGDDAQQRCYKSR